MGDGDPGLMYTKQFDPAAAAARPRGAPKPDAGVADRAAGEVYVYTDEIILAVNVAMATGRSLLVRGPSGTGKSFLAKAAAEALGWRLYTHPVTSRTEAKDLLWQVDLLRRLSDAQLENKELNDDYTPYVVPGVLWWAFNEFTAKDQRVRSAVRKKGESEADFAKRLKDLDPNKGAADAARAVVLLDEIDKADPDTPNNLLVPLGSLEFTVEETNQKVRADRAGAPLLIITTNEERELPAAFLRRCVELKIECPFRDRMVQIGQRNVPDAKKETLNDLADVMKIPKAAADGTPTTSPAEFVDALRACAQLKVNPKDPAFERLMAATIFKHGKKKPGA